MLLGDPEQVISSLLVYVLSSVNYEARTRRLMRILQLSNDVSVGYPHQFLLLARHSSQVEGLWLSEL